MKLHITLCFIVEADMNRKEALQDKITSLNSNFGKTLIPPQTLCQDLKTKVIVQACG